MLHLVLGNNTLFVIMCCALAESRSAVKVSTKEFDITYVEKIGFIILIALGIIAVSILLWYVFKRTYDNKNEKRKREGEERERLLDLKKDYQGKLLASLEGDKSDDAKAQYRDRLNGFLEETNRELEKLDTNK